MRMAPKIATADKVDRSALLDFLRPRHHGLLSTTRSSGRPQLSPVSCGVDGEGRILVATYPERAKTRNARRDDRVSICVVSDDWNGPYVQVDGHAEVLDMPEAEDDFVEYYRCIAGEHPDWDEYRAAMVTDRRLVVRFRPEHTYGQLPG
jgi:PPOX class probable F420-dependent enzyme